MLPIPISLQGAAESRAAQLALDLIQAGWNRLESGDVPASMAQFQRAVKLAPEACMPHLALAHGALRFGRLRRSLEHAHRVLELDAGHAAAHRLCARAHFGLGEDDSAQQHLDRVLADNGNDPEALYLLAHHGIRGDVEHLSTLAAGTVEEPEVARELGMALANAQRMQGDLRVALQTALGVRGAFAPTGLSAEELRMQSDLMRVLTSLPWGQGGGCRVGEPIFVVGLPHSGAMLAERALTAPGQSLAAGPVRALGHLASKLPRCVGAPYPRAAAVLDPHTATVLANRYREHAGVGHAVRWVDRCPDGVRYLPLALRMFPQAEVVHVTRDVHAAWEEACLSLFDGQDAAYVVDEESFLAQAAFEARLVDLVEATLPVVVHRMRYEDLIADPDGAVAGLRRCG